MFRDGTDRHTHRHTNRHGDSMTNSAQWGRVGENHLAEHTLTSKEKIDVKSLAICKKNKEAILNSKRWRDMYDDQGNPLFETTDEENSSEDEENCDE